MSIKEVLKHMTDGYVTYDGWPILWTTRMLASQFDVSMYKMRKFMKPLKEDGDIEYQYWQPPCGGTYEYGCDCDNHLGVWGYRINKQQLRQEEEELGTSEQLSDKGSE